MSTSPDVSLVRVSLSSSALPVLAGAAVYALLLLNGDALLNDPDSFWQVKMGQDILRNGAVPRTDAYSFTMAGQPWISTQWLAQVIFALAFRVAGWSGPVILAAAAAALAFAILARELMRRLQPVAVLAFVLIAFVLTASHLLARPHVLTLPILVFWAARLLRASEQREPPPLVLAGLIVLWANLHGGFIFGLALIVPIMLDALVSAEPAQRRFLAQRWVLFGVVAGLCSGITPYGFEALAGSKRILDLGPALQLINEWRPTDFGKLGPFEVVLLADLALSWWRGVTLPVVRILLVIGLVHLALTAERNHEVLALLAPLVVAAPLARQGLGRDTAPPALSAAAVSAGVGAFILMTLLAITTATYVPNPRNTPHEALAHLKAINAQRVLNDYEFGGFMIWNGMPTFIDGRTELFGASMLANYSRALEHAEPVALAQLLAQHRIDAVLVRSDRHSVDLFALMPGWIKVHADPVATVIARGPK